MNGDGLQTQAEHHFRRVVPGAMDGVREGLCEALEQMEYVVMTESPIHAKRGAQKSLMTANVLEYGVKLTVGLKAISPTSTLATFDYTVPYIFSQGDKLALEREGEALIALATSPLRSAYCPSCGIENAGDVRFCRACGTPLIKNALTAEIGLMRLTANASSAYVEISWGVVTLILTLIASLLLIFLGGPKPVNVGRVLLLLGSAVSLFFLLAGVFRLRCALSQKSAAAAEPPPLMTRNTSRHNTAALPAPPASVTEGTTELMNPPEAEALPVRSKPRSVNTNEMG